MAAENVRQWKIGNVEVSRIVEVDGASWRFTFDPKA